MRQNVTVALLSVIATLLAVMVFTSPTIVVGQNLGGGTATIGGEIAVATGSLQGAQGSAFWVYVPSEKRIAVYTLGNQGLELRSVRDVQYDLKAIDLNIPQGKVTKVRDVKKEIQKEAKEAKSKEE